MGNRVLTLTRWFFLCLSALIILTLAAGSIYQVTAERRDLANFPPPGDLIDVNGSLMHIYCLGEGSPTVIVEQGLGSLSMAWSEIHKTVAKITRVCAYDRPGMGYSDLVDHPIRSKEVAQRLHQLLATAGVDDELILVGWSAGGVYIRDYHKQFPRNVKAMLLVDSSHEQQGDRMRRAPEDGGGDPAMEIGAYLARFGLIRLSGLVRLRFNDYEGPDHLREPMIAIFHRSDILRAMLNESEAFETDIHSINPPLTLGELPLIVLSRGKPVALEDNMPPWMTLALLQDWEASWQQLQKELTSLSSNSKQVIATRSGHGIHAEQPELVIESITELVVLVRQQEP